MKEDAANSLSHHLASLSTLYQTQGLAIKLGKKNQYILVHCSKYHYSHYAQIILLMKLTNAIYHVALHLLDI